MTIVEDTMCPLSQWFVTRWIIEKKWMNPPNSKMPQCCAYFASNRSLQTQFFYTDLSNYIGELWCTWFYVNSQWPYSELFFTERRMKNMM